MIFRRLGYALALAALTLAAAGGLRHAANIGLLDADEARRMMQVLIGLGLAAYANAMPKQTGRGSLRALTRTQAALRVGGWSFTLAGLAYAGLWAFAPLSLADVAGAAVVAAALVATLGYTVWSFTACQADQAS